MKLIRHKNQYILQEHPTIHRLKKWILQLRIGRRYVYAKEHRTLINPIFSVIPAKNGFTWSV